MSANVRYVAKPGALKKIARSDDVAYGALEPAAHNGAAMASALTGEPFNVKVYKRGKFRARAVIFPVNIQKHNKEKKRRALERAIPHL